MCLLACCWQKCFLSEIFILALLLQLFIVQVRSLDCSCMKQSCCFLLDYLLILIQTFFCCFNCLNEQWRKVCLLVVNSSKSWIILSQGSCEISGTKFGQKLNFENLSYFWRTRFCFHVFLIPLVSRLSFRCLHSPCRCIHRCCTIQIHGTNSHPHMYFTSLKLDLILASAAAPAWESFFSPVCRTSTQFLANIAAIPWAFSKLQKEAWVFFFPDFDLLIGRSIYSLFSHCWHLTLLCVCSRAEWVYDQQRRLLSCVRGPTNRLWLPVSCWLSAPGQKDLWR